MNKVIFLDYDNKINSLCQGARIEKRGNKIYVFRKKIVCFLRFA